MVSVDLYTLFDNFVTANNFKQILHTFYLICTQLDLDPTDSKRVYEELRKEINDWRAQKLWKLLDKKWTQTEYRSQKAANRLNVLIIGAGPCGLRTAIECALLGSRVVLIEQRDKFSRNNVLHLWEFVIHDLKSFGAKIFYPKFCTGSIEHISIRQMQCILLKVALCYGVQVYEGVTYKDLLTPQPRFDKNETYSGFRASLEPADHLLGDYEFDVLIGADGKRNTIKGFSRITANFVNRHTAAEERVPEISGVAYIFNQAFFKEMHATTGVDLENIVYYKDETHYFVMCAKKQSLLEQGVILKDCEDVNVLLSAENVNKEQLCRYAYSAAQFATNGKLPILDYATNHKSQPDIAMFDFTSLYSSKYSVRLIERNKRRLLLGIVGDSLHEPFWPTGSGCARGFLGVMDTAWLIKEYGMNEREPLQLIAERESIYRLLAQVTKDNLHKQLTKFTIDPKTRYVSLEITMRPEDVVEIVDSDAPRSIYHRQPHPRLDAHEHPERMKYAAWRFLTHALTPYKLKLYDMNTSWNDGMALAALVAKFRPECLDYFNVLSSSERPKDRLEMVFSRVREHLEIAEPCTPEQWPRLSEELKLDYIYALIGLIKSDMYRVRSILITPRSAASKRPKPMPTKFDTSKAKKSAVIENLHGQIKAFYERGKPTDQPTPPPLRRQLEHLPSIEEPTDDSRYLTKKPQVSALDPALVGRVEKFITGKREENKAKISVEEVEQVEIQRQEVREVVVDEGQQLANISGQEEKIPQLPEPDSQSPSLTLVTRRQDGSVVMRPVAPRTTKARQNTCQLCNEVVFLAERMQVESMYVHRGCFKCSFCSQPLRLGECGQDRELDKIENYRNKFFCKTHLRLPLREKIGRIEYTKKKALAKQASQDEGASSDSSKGNLSESPAQIINRFPLQALPSPILPIRVPACPPKTASSSNMLHYYGSDQRRLQDLVLPNAKRVLTSPVDSDQNGLLSTPERAAFDAQQERPKFIKKAVDIDSESEEEGTSGSNSSRERTGSSSCYYSSKEETDSSLRSRSNTQDVDLNQTFIDDEGNHDESLSDEEDNFAEEDLQELEKTVLEITEQNPSNKIEESIARSVLERINSRRRESIRHESIRHTATNFNQMGADTSTKVDQPGHRSESTLMRGSSVDLDRLREEARRRARMKSDEQLGILNTPLSRSKTRSPPPTLFGRDRAATTGQLDDSAQLPTMLNQVDLRRQAFSASRADTAPESDLMAPPLPARTPPKQTFYGFLSPNLQHRSTTTTALTESAEKIKEPIQSESSKENGLRARNSIWDQLRGQRNHSPIAPIEAFRGVPLASPSLVINSDHVPCAAVAPSPRPPATTIAKTTVFVPGIPPMPTAAGQSIASLSASSSVAADVPTLAPSDRNLRFIQKRGEKIRRQHEEDRLRTAQDLQRQLDESETRLEAIERRGRVVEANLNSDPTSVDLLSEWRSLVQEKQILTDREKDLQLKAKEVRLEHRYRELDALINQQNDLKRGNDDDDEKASLLREMLSIIDQRKELKRELDETNVTWRRRKVKQSDSTSHPSRATTHTAAVDYRQCNPVFLCI
ncbi:unnamed protein product, partial [Mesorhabditis belari]|uniref:F-actin monooxygenase n=1 Tax=Mesorhabditis belari TaxID=2138241 RepID=A0AAF3F9A0_9BILA